MNSFQFLELLKAIQELTQAVKELKDVHKG